MKTKQTLLVVIVGILTIGAAKAQDNWSDRLTFDPGAALYSPNELSLDLYGFHGSLDKGGGNHGAWGPGVGLNYFVTDYIGFGADTYADAFEPPYLLDTSAIFRYPVGKTGLAPYAFAGIGRQWFHAPQWLGYFGGGVEYRLNAKTGVFTDLRGVFPGETRDYSVWRFGFRVAF